MESRITRSARLTPLFPLVAVFLLLSMALRLVLWWSFGRTADVSAAALVPILFSGALADMVQALYLTLIPAVFLLLIPERARRSRWHRRGMAVAVFLSLFGMLYLSTAEYFFFEEFDARFNLVAVDYLLYPHEVLVNIWDSYPVLQVVAVALLFSFLLFKGVWPFMRGHFTSEDSLRRRFAFLGVHLCLVLVAVAGISTDTFTPAGNNRVADELAVNGVSSFFRALRTNELNYAAFYRTLDSDRAFSPVRNDLAKGSGEFLSGDQGDITRTFKAEKEGLGKMNIVVIVEESFGANYVGAYGDARNLTPNFDRLAQQGLLFSKTYATGTRTVRGLEAITTSLPPIPSESVIKRPGSERMASWGKVMEENGYVSSFLYGGYGYFDNMNHFFGSNGFDLSDRGDIPDPTFANIWGVCDEDLFNHALDYFDNLQGEGRPFFSIIMSTSNHKPFTFPEGIEGVPAEGGGRRAGIRYADYAIGRFFEQAPGHPWFDNTLFVIVADHGARVYGRAQIPVRTYEIPLLIYAPGRLEPGVVDTATSQIDIAPTVLGLLGLPYSAPFYGQDVLALREGAPRPILLNHNHDVALYEDDRLAVLGLNRSAETVGYSREENRQYEVSPEPELVNRATAYYQTAFDLFSTHGYE